MWVGGPTPSESTGCSCCWKEGALECWEGAAAKKWQENSKRAVAVHPLIARQQEFRRVGPPIGHGGLPNKARSCLSESFRRAVSLCLVFRRVASECFRIATQTFGVADPEQWDDNDVDCPSSFRGRPTRQAQCLGSNDIPESVQGIQGKNRRARGRSPLQIADVSEISPREFWAERGGNVKMRSN